MSYNQTEPKSKNTININSQKHNKNTNSYSSATDVLQQTQAHGTSHLSHSISLPSTLQDLTMTIKEEQAIQDILKQTMTAKYSKNKMESQNANTESAYNKNRHTHYTHNYDFTNLQNNYQLDEDIMKMLMQSEQQIGKQYDKMAKEQLWKNRQSISINDNQDMLKQIFQKMDARSQLSKQANFKKSNKQVQPQSNNNKRKESCVSSFSVNTNNEQSPPKSAASLESEGFGTAFNLDTNKLKANYEFDDIFAEPTKQMRYRSNTQTGITKTKTKQIQKQKQRQRQKQRQEQEKHVQYNDAQSDIEQKEQNNGQNIKVHEQLKQTVANQPYILDKFEQQQVLKPKQHSLQISQLDQKYPKINPMSMYKHQYPIFKFTQSSTSKYLRYLKKSMNEISCAVSFLANSNVKWTILAIEHLLYIFVGEDWKEPIIINPQRNVTQASSSNESSGIYDKVIKNMVLSPQNNYLAINLGVEIIIYQIKKQANNLVLVKNLSSADELNAKLAGISKLIFYDESPIKLAFIDNQQSIYLATVEQIMLFTRVSQKQIHHGMDIVMDMAVLNLLNSQVKAKQESKQKKGGFGFGKFGLNQKINNLMSKSNTAYIALASRSTLMLYRIQPSIQLLYSEQLDEQTTKNICISWRYHPQIQVKPQLFISYNNKIYIYKLMESESDGSLKNKQIYLQLHLMYQNHYDIMQMEIISNTHLLLLSDENIIVIAIPLIPSTDLSSIKSNNQDSGDSSRVRKGSGTHNEIFESALIFITSQKDCRVLFSSFEQVLYYSCKQESLRVAKLKTLQQHLDQLMLQHGHFRQAFTLLILVHKGVNYSFKFSYTTNELTQCIFTAIQCTVGSLILTMQQNIVQYRLGWVCQLLLETQNQAMIWTTVYKKLKEKQKERDREEQLAMHKFESQQGTKILHNQRNSFFQNLSSEEYNTKHLLKKHSNEQDQKKQNKFTTHKYASMIDTETTSSQLLPKARKSLQHVLFDILEIFVLKSLVTSMPQQIFLQFVSYQCEKKSDTVVQKIIIQNKQSYDGLKLLTLLQTKERNYLQLFLFSRALICQQPDFYTPFIKVYSSFRNCYQQIERGIKHEQELKNMKQKLNMTGLMCLWYLRKCLRFERIPSGVMPLNQKLAIISTMCTQMLEPDITRKLFTFSPKVFLQTYLLMFIGAEVSLLLDEQNQYLVTKYKQFYPITYQQIMSVPPSSIQNMLKNQNAQANQIFDKSFKQLAVLHLERTILNVRNHRLYWAEFLALAFYFNPIQICLTFEASVDILIVFFENKFDSYNLCVPPKTQLPTIQHLQITLIEYIKPILVQKKDRFYINKLLNFNDKVVSYYLYRVDQNYKLALQHFIVSKNSHKLIQFIHQLLSDIKQIGENTPPQKNSRQKKFGQIKQFLVKNAGLLFKSDKNQALNIFYEIGETTQTIYNIIQQNMVDKLDFLTAVLKKFQHQDFPLKQKFQLEHLSQICRLKNKQMLQYLDKYFYPLDQAIIVCEQKGNLLAKAILQQRCGRISDAFNSYQRIVKGIIQSNNSQSNQLTKSEKQIKRDVQKYTQECIRLCKKHPYDQNSGPQDNFWLRIITFINGFIKSNSQHKVFLKVQFEKVLQHILNQMFKFLPTNILIDFFIAKGHKLELTSTKQFSIFENLFILAKFDIGVQKKVLQICKLDVKDTRKQTLATRKHGIISVGLCDFCKKSLLQYNTCSIFYCKHSFHKLCHDDSYRCLTCYYESDDSVLRSNIFGTEMQKGSFDNNQFVQQIDKNKKQKANKDLQNVQIIIQSANAVRLENIKKKLKVYDFQDKNENRNLEQIVEGYEEKQKKKKQEQQQQEFETEYIKYTKAKGLQIKQRNSYNKQQLQKKKEQ